MDLAIFMMTVYDYFYPRQAAAAEEERMDDEAKPAEGSHNTDSLLLAGGERKRRFRSMQEETSGSLYPFDSDEESDQEETKEADGYTRMGNEPVEVRYGMPPEEPGLVRRFWTGAGEIMQRYQRRKKALERHSANTVKESIGGLLEGR